MSATTRLFAISVSKLPRRRRSRIATAFRRLAEGCLYWLQRGVPGAIGYRLAQVAVACGLAATVAGGFAHAGGGGGGGITDVNQRSGLVTNPNIARDADGDYVTVWQAYNHDGSGWGIYGRRYRANGQPASPQFRVNQVTSGDQENPKVAMDADGDFVVVWQGTGSTGNGVWGRRFTFEGAPMGGDFNVALASGSEFVGLPDVAMDAHGNFVVAWTQGSGNYDIHARRFNNVGAPAGVSFMVNAANSVNDSWPAVAMDYSGNFVVAWNTYQNGYDVVARRYNASGTAQGSQFQVNDPGHPYAHFHQYRPDIAMDVDGDFVIAWASDGQDVYWYYWSSYSSWPYYFNTTEVQWRRYNAAGTLQGSDVIASSSYPYIVKTGAPSVTMDADGDFVIAYAGHLASYWSPFSADYEVRWVEAIEYRADGSFSDSRTPAFSYSWGSGTTYYTNAAVAMDADGDYVIAWYESYNYWYSDIRQTGTYGLDNGHTGNAAPIVAGVYVPGDHHRVRNNEVLPQNITRLVVTFSENMDTATVNDLSNWGLHRGSVPVPVNNVNFLWQDDLNRYAALLDFGATPLAEGAYQLTFSGAEDDFGNIVDGNMNGASGGIFSLNFRVGMPQQIGAEVTVHQSTSLTQQHSDVAMDADGNYVVVWQHYGHSSGSGHDIMARVFDRHGVPQTDEFIVNRTIFGGQRRPSVAMDGDGNFVVVWEGRGDDSYSPFPRDNQGIFARRFDNTGAPMGDEFWVNPEPFANVTFQGNPDVAMDRDGNFVVVWDGAGAFYSSYDSSGVFMMRFDKDGGSIGSIRRVNNNTSNYQGNPAVAMDADGDFVVVYESYNSGFFFIPSTYRIQAARFDKDGYKWGDDQITTFGEAIQVQFNPDVAMDADGDFVIVYGTAQIYQYSYSYSSSFYYGTPAIYAQRFNSDGSRIDSGHPIRVDEPGFHGSYGQRVTMDEDGDFVVAWAQYDIGYYQYDVRVRRFNWLGQAQGLPFSPTVYPHERQFDPAVAMSNDGRFAVTWTHETPGSYMPVWTRGGGGDSDIRASRYGLNEAPVVIGGGIANVAADEDDPPIIVDLTAAFGDSSDPGVNLIYTVTANSNPGLVNTAINPDSGELTLTLLPDANGTATITVRATDTGGQWVEDSFNVVIAPVNDAPVLDNSSSPHGIAVAGIEAIPYEIGDVVRSSITDVDAGALKGVAIIAATGNGVWQYRVDATGTWEDFPAVFATSALLLDENDDVRFVPAAGATGTAILQYRAWDQTDGNSPGDTADVSTNGGITAYSADQDTLTLTIVDGNVTVQQIINKKNEGGCAAEDASAAPWGLLALVSLLLGGLLTRRRKGVQQ